MSAPTPSRSLVLQSALFLTLLHPHLASADVIAASQVDFSTSGFTGLATPQTPVNGFLYGYYNSPDATTGPFSTEGMGTFGGDRAAWKGNEGGDAAPIHQKDGMHPGLLVKPVVRRYTVGSGGEPAISGEVRIAGRFFDLNTGSTDAFITIDPDGDAGPAPRTLLLGPSPVVDIAGAVVVDVTTTVGPNTTIDFGVLANGAYYSDSTGFYASIVTGDTPVATSLLASGVGSTNFDFSAGSQDLSGVAFAMVTDGIIGSSDAATFDTSPGNAFPYHFAGLLYRENAGSGKATRFDSVRIDLTTAGDFTEPPGLYILRHNSDPKSNNPAADDRYARLPILPVRIASNSAGQPAYTFDLSGLPAAQRTGYGFAVTGAGRHSGGSIIVSEISSVAVRVADSAVIAPQPFLVEGPGGHRYGYAAVRGDWNQVEASAVAAGGHLVTINDPAENDYLVAQFGTEPVFIGLKQDPAPELETVNGWRWRTGELVNYQGPTNWYNGGTHNWNSGEPNGYEGADEDYAMMNIGRAGGWDDVRAGGYPSSSNFRGLIEVPTPAPGVTNFQVNQVSARANIFDAGLTVATQGGVLPPSMDVSGYGGRAMSFPQIVGTINTAADLHGPDGAHTAGRSCDLNAVGGISGYLNGDNTPALVGVFLAASQPASPPARIDFSATGLGENFNTLAPALGQVFFIGDGLNQGGIAQNFTIPAGAVKLYLGIPDGNNGTLYHGTPLGYGDNSGSINVRASLLPVASPTITNPSFPFGGGPLAISGGTGPYTVVVSTGSLPAGLSISSAGVVSGTAGPGNYYFTILVTDSLGGTFERAYNGTITAPELPAQSIIGWWPGENASGDVVGGNHAAVPSGNQNYVPGKVGQAFSFNGVDQSLATPTSTAVLNQLPLTIEGWVKPEMHATGSINDPLPPNVISNDRQNFGGHGFGVHIYPNGSKLNIGVQGVGVDFHTVPAVTFVPDEWVHIAVVYSSGQAQTYVNGVLKSTVTYTQDSLAGDPVVRIGRHNDDTGYGTRRFFKGAIDELTLHNHTLGAAEIGAIHAAGAAGKPRHDAALQFSPTQNPGAVWSYHWAPPTGSGYIPLADGVNLLTAISSPSPDIQSWGSQAVVTSNTSASPVTIPAGGTIPASGAQYDWRPGQLGMSPGSSGNSSVVRWTAPQAGKYAVSGTFYGCDTQPTTVDIHIYHNSSELTPSGKRGVASYRGSGVSHTQTIDVAADDTVDFIVGTGTGGYTYDSTGLAASVVLLNQPVLPPPDIAVEYPADSFLTDAADTVDFGYGVMNSVPLVRTFKITNNGGSNLTGLSATLDGSNRSEFIAGLVGSTLLAPGSSTWVAVGFYPSSTGFKRCTLRIASNDPDEGSFDIAMSGAAYPAGTPSLYAWGSNGFGAVGDNTLINRPAPVPVLMSGALAGKTVVSVFTATDRSFAISSDGLLYAWGENVYGELGDGTTTNRSQPIAVDMTGDLLGKTVVAVSSTNLSTLALTADGEVFAWGRNQFGQLGLGDTVDRLSPRKVGGLLEGKIATAVSCGGSHGLVITADGTLFGFGRNQNGELGDGTTSDRLSPVGAVTTGTLLEGKIPSAIMAADSHSVVLTAEGSVFSFGQNSNGQLGDGSTTDRLAPVAVAGGFSGKTVVSISGSSSHHHALTTEGVIYGWGFNDGGRLGDSTTTSRTSPVPLDASGVLAGKTVARFETSHSGGLVLSTDNKLFAWGENFAGQIGDGTVVQRLSPVAVNMTGVLAGKTVADAGMKGFGGLVIAYPTPAPEISVTKPGAVSIETGAVADLGTALPGGSTTLELTLRNSGNATLSGLSAQLTGPDSAHYSLVGPGVTSLAPNTTATVTVTFQPTTSGPRSVSLLIASNDTDESTFQITLIGTGGVPITAWRDLYFQTTQNAGNAADDADPDKDGVSNLLEFATGEDPKNASPVETPVTAPNDGILEFTYTRNKAAMAELTYQVRWTDSLSGAWQTTGVTETVVDDNGQIQEVTVSVPAGPNGHRFVHLQVTRPAGP